jgi:hypothetical protein
MRKCGIHTEFWWGSPKKGNYEEDLDVCGRILLKWILEKGRGAVRTAFFWHMIETRFCEHGDKPSNSIKFSEILEWLLKKD